MPGPIGTIGILTSEQGRFSRFWNCFLGLDAPGPVHVITKISLNIAEARNQILKEALGDWVWFIDDDQTFAPTILTRLLSHEVDIVQPVVLTRYHPFGPVHMGPETPDGKKNWRYALLDDDPHGLKEVHIVGTSGMLLRRYVWEALAFPWFEMGQVNPEVTSEDLYFCRKARKAGFRIFTDLGAALGHMTTVEIWPERQKDGSWVTDLRVGGTSVAIPAASAKFRLQEDGYVVDADGAPVPADGGRSSR